MSTNFWDNPRICNLNDTLTEYHYNDQTPYWKIVRTLIIGTKPSYSIPSLFQNDTVAFTSEDKCDMLKAILQVLIYKALYDKSYLGSKTTMTSAEWTCLISFATAPLTCSERGGSEKFKMKIYVSSGIRTHAPPVHDRKVAAP